MYTITPLKSEVREPITDDVIMGEVKAPVDDKIGVSDLLSAVGTFDATTQQPDNLKKVKGIGPQMEATLNEIGIYTFAQVARMTESEYNLLDSITGSFPGRAQRDDWAGQAAILLNNKR